MIRLDNGRIGMAIADVSGKGVPASLFMMSSRTLLKGAAIGHEDPGAVLSEVNNLLIEDNRAGMFVTVLYAIYDPASGELTYASGGHDAPLLVRPDGSSDLLPRTGGIALGVAPDFEFREHSEQISAGDTVVLYTDGVTEAMNMDEEPFGVEGMSKLFAAAPPQDPEQAGMEIVKAINEFSDGAEQFDDSPA